ncbi:MAG: ring-cleaving dioxygenase [Thermodesulfobacteriales bacterium]|nr:MAG: ring-cleaving dioxygenase [Thermodesulfobacteriales bacterium]
MSANILGLHHVTAIAGNAKRNYDFYTKVLGLRLVKKTVNFDDPGTYHFYYGNQAGEPGTIITFFPWEGIRRGASGTGQATSTSFSIPKDSIPFWLKRFQDYEVNYNNPSSRFDEKVVTFLDPDGLKLELVSHTSLDERKSWITSEISTDQAIRGFYNVTLTLEGYERTANLLIDLFGYEIKDEHINRFRFVNNKNENANIMDLVCLPSGKRGTVAGGSVHHIAFRVKDETEQLQVREKLIEMGYNVTPQLDRSYFKSVYFREPGGVLFEIATDPPGFTADEDINSLGEELKLPSWLEPRREEIENVLPELS